MDGRVEPRRALVPLDQVLVVVPVIWTKIEKTTELASNSQPSAIVVIIFL